ncbi:MAG: hypothetical protein ACPGN3_08320 [Opitutales bacterium]
MKNLSVICLALSTTLSVQASWLDSLFGKNKEEEAAPSASVAGLDLGAMTDQFTKNVLDFSKASGDSMLKSLGGDLTEQVSSLAGMLGQDPQAAGDLAGTLSELGGTLSTTNWTELLEGFSGLASGELGEKEQASLTKTMELATAFGLQSFLKDSPYYSDVTDAVSSLQGGKYIEAIPPLKKLLDEAKLSDSQQAMIDSSVGYFSDLAKSKGGDMLKQGIGSLFGN